MTDYIAELREAVDNAAVEFRAVSPDVAARRPGINRWSAKEIIGHLIDSASNNHQRFVRSCFQEDLVFPGYDQDAWVELQNYQDASWMELVNLWRDYNHHLARVMAAIPEHIRLREHHRHNLHEIAWQTVPKTEPATFDYFMRDYVGHLQHHLTQVRQLLNAS